MGWWVGGWPARVAGSGGSESRLNGFFVADVARLRTCGACLRLSLSVRHVTCGVAAAAAQSRSESRFGESVSEVLKPALSTLSISRLGARVQHGLTPTKLRDSTWSGSLAPKVMVK